MTSRHKKINIVSSRIVVSDDTNLEVTAYADFRVTEAIRDHFRTWQHMNDLKISSKSFLYKIQSFWLDVKVMQWEKPTHGTSQQVKYVSPSVSTVGK